MKRYRTRYTALKQGVQLVKDWDCSSPITALNNVHRFIQLEQGYGIDAYRIDSLHQIYNSDAKGGVKGEFVESKFDLPDCRNPDMTPLHQHPNADSDQFPGISEATGGKLAD